jgi:hypothetical protein
MIGRDISAELVKYAWLAQCSTETPVLSALLGGAHGSREGEKQLGETSTQ